jgi:agmatine deiminase
MTWTMPPETAPQDRIWMCFPKHWEGSEETEADRAPAYAAWTEVAQTIADFLPVTMIVDPSETQRARNMLGSDITQIGREIDDYWLRDSGPTFVHAADGSVAAVDWIFNAWGGHSPRGAGNDRGLAAFMAGVTGVPLIPSLLVNEGGGIHVDGEGTVLLTETVQLDPGRNPHADLARVEAEIARTLGCDKAIWLKRGLTRDYEAHGTRGHVDIVATFPSPGRVLIHDQRDPGHPDHRVTAEVRAVLAEAQDARGRRLEIIDLPAPDTLRDADGFVDYSYVNHLVVNGGVIACGFGESRADARAAEILAAAYPGRKVVTVDARPIFARGGGIHCITQQQPKVRR